MLRFPRRKETTTPVAWTWRSWTADATSSQEKAAATEAGNKTICASILFATQFCSCHWVGCLHIEFFFGWRSWQYGDSDFAGDVCTKHCVGLPWWWWLHLGCIQQYTLNFACCLCSVSLFGSWKLSTVKWANILMHSVLARLFFVARSNVLVLRWDEMQTMQKKMGSLFLRSHHYDKACRQTTWWRRFHVWPCQWWMSHSDL